MSKTKKDIKPITLQGSAKLVADYFYYSVNSIIYQRCVRPMESFEQETFCSMPVLVSTEKEVLDEMMDFLKDIRTFLEKREVTKLHLFIVTKEKEEPLEQWVFDIEYEGLTDNDDEENPNVKNLPIAGNKDVGNIKTEICQVFRQIIGSISYLPLIDCPCDYVVAVTMTPHVPLKVGWIYFPSDSLGESEQVRLRSFSTSLHKVHTTIYYKDD